MKRYLALAVILLSASPVWAQINTVITDGSRPFSEGVLVGYEVQMDGRALCTNPVVHGRYIACNGQATKQVWVESNGVLGAYIVVDSEGRQVCENPMIWNQFRGQVSYIVCD